MVMCKWGVCWSIVLYHGFQQHAESAWCVAYAFERGAMAEFMESLLL